jgi:hypothetical protein
MRPHHVHQEPEPEVIDLVSESEDDPEDQEPEVVDLVSDSEDDDDMAEDPEEPEPDVPAVVGDIPTVANQVRIGEWRYGFWHSPGNWSNLGHGEDPGCMYLLNEPPNDGVRGGLNLWRGPTIGELWFDHWRHNEHRFEEDQGTLGESVYKTWLDAPPSED